MVLKLTYNNQIHRIAKTPSTFHDLVQIVNQLFQGQLPERWTLQYVDSDGDSIMLSDEHDFQNLLEGELHSSAKSVKVFVTAVDGINQSQLTVNQSMLDSSVAKSEAPKQEDDFQVIERQEANQIEEPKIEQLIEEPKVSQPIEEPKVEEVPEVKNEVVEENVELEAPKEEVQEAAAPVEEKKCKQGREKCKRYRLKKILKKLSRSDLPEAKRQRLEAKLKLIESTLTPEQWEEYVAKKQKFVAKQAAKKVKADQEFKEKVTEVLYQYLPTIASLTKEYVLEDKNKAEAQKQPEPQVQVNPPVVHSHVICDECNTAPIVGIRYKCATCPDFDLCEKCEAKTEHPHAFIKIKNPEQMRHNRGPHGPRGHGFGPRGQCPRFGGFPGFGGGFGCPFGGNRKPENEEERKKLQEFHKNMREFKSSDSFKNLVGSFMGMSSNLSNEAQEKMEKDVENLYSTLPQNLKETVRSKFENLPQMFREHLNNLLRGLPERLLGEKKEENIQEVQVNEEKIQEVIIQEEPVPVEEVKAQVNENVYAPIIQEVEVVAVEQPKEEKVEEPKKEYPQEVVEKATFLKEIFPESNQDDILEFVAKTPSMTIEELVENYLSL